MTEGNAGNKENHHGNSKNEVPTDVNTMSDKDNDHDNTSDNLNQGEEEAVSMIQEETTADVASANSDPSESPQEADTISELPVVPSSCVEVDQGLTTSAHPVAIDSKAGRKLVGKKVETAFGVGVVVDFRSKDAIYEIRLESNSNDSNRDAKSRSKSLATLYSVQAPKVCKPSPAEIANQLNVAYEALETMRRLNLDVQCHEAGIPSCEVDYDMCTCCLLANKSSSKSHFPRLQQFVDTAHAAGTEFVESAHAAGTDLDQQVKEQLPGLHRLFNPLPRKRQGLGIQGLFSRNPSSQQMAARISASLVEASTFTSTISTTVATAVDGPNSAITLNESSQSANESNKAAHTPSTSTGNTPTPPSSANSSNTKGTSLSGNSTKKTATAPNRMKNMWGSIQRMPQPAAPRGSASTTSDSTTILDPSTLSSASLKVAGAANSAAIGFRGLMKSSLNNSVTKTIFGETKVKEEGSVADPNVILNNRISNMSLANTPSSSKRVPPKSNKPIALPRIQRLMTKRAQANTSPCLICGSPSCAACSSPSFRKEGITLCLKCERLFELDFIVDCVSSSDPAQRAERIEYMVDCYDRCMLLLKYSKQFAEQIAASLEDQKNKQDKIGLASSSVGVLSGVLGIAAAATILSPAGPPLLIASLFFGGSATTVQSGTEALNYLSEPRKLADRIIALHGMSLSILRVTSTLRDAMMRDHIRTDVYEAEGCKTNQKIAASYQRNKTNIVMGSNTFRSISGFAGVEAGAIGTAAAAGAATEAGAMGAAAGARVSTAVSRAGTAAARTVRFARFAGGALSAAVLVMEANAIQSTVKSISQGSPCDKANKLREVLKEIEDFPSTSDLDHECQSYLSVLSSRPEPPIEVDAVTDDSNPGDAEIIEAPCQQVDDGRLCVPGAVILEEAARANANPSGEQHPMAAAVPVQRHDLPRPARDSLFSRMQNRREDRRVAREEVVAVAVEDTQLGESNFSLLL